MPKEISTFIKYDKKGSEVAAVFYDRADQGYFSLTREGCEERLKELREGGYLHDQTLAALRGWPEK